MPSVLQRQFPYCKAQWSYWSTYADGTIQKLIDDYVGDNATFSGYKSPEGVSRTNGTLIMATNAYFKPYEYYEGGSIIGIDADIAQAIADYLGMNLKIEDMEFDSIITAVSSGKADLVWLV